MSIELYGITKDDIQKMMMDAIKDRVGKPIFGLDANYLYSFDISDLREIKKPKQPKEWHRNLERWYTDQTVRDSFGREIKPTQLVRHFDKIVNEGLEMLAGCIVGEESTTFKYSILGDADDVTEAFADATQVGNQISRIDVTQTGEGGSLSRDGSVIYIIGNHPASIASTTVTESAVADTDSSTTDMLLDYTVFPVGIDHDQFLNALGVTTVIYMCGL